MEKGNSVMFIGTEKAQIEKQWANKLQKAEEQEKAHEIRDFYEFAMELKNTHFPNIK